jgi:hypothetical protein
MNNIELAKINQEVGQYFWDKAHSGHGSPRIVAKYELMARISYAVARHLMGIEVAA